MEEQVFDSNQSEREYYVCISESVLGDKRLTAGDKLVYARTTSFKKCFETAEGTAEFLGISVRAVLRSRAKLVKLGLILEVGNNGKGKSYVKAPTQEQISAFFGDGDMPKCPDDMPKCPDDMPKWHTYNKATIKEEQKIILSKERISQDDSLQVEEKAEKHEFGNHDLNEAVKLWEDATGFDYSTNAFERRTIYNLTRRKDVKALGGYERLCELVKKARHMDNQFAPKIVKPSEMSGKYSKLDKLIDWAKRSEEESAQKTNAKGNKFTRPLTECEDALIRSYFKPCPYVRSPKADDNGPTAEDIEKADGGGAEQESKWDASAPDFYQKMREIAFGKLNKKKGDSDEAK